MSGVSSWPAELDALLMELIAEDELTFAQIGRRLGVTKGAAIGRFGRIAFRMGWQADVCDPNGVRSDRQRRAAGPVFDSTAAGQRLALE